MGHDPSEAVLLVGAIVRVGVVFDIATAVIVVAVVGVAVFFAFGFGFGFVSAVTVAAFAL